MAGGLEMNPYITIMLGAAQDPVVFLNVSSSRTTVCSPPSHDCIQMYVVVATQMIEGC